MPQFKAPNGLLINRVFEKVPCAVGITDIAEDGQSFTYDHTGADMWWEDQYPERNQEDSSFIFIDEEGDQWTFDQLTKVEEEDQEEDVEGEAPPPDLDLLAAKLRELDSPFQFPAFTGEGAEALAKAMAERGVRAGWIDDNFVHHIELEV